MQLTTSVARMVALMVCGTAVPVSGWGYNDHGENPMSTEDIKLLQSARTPHPERPASFNASYPVVVCDLISTVISFFGSAFIACSVLYFRKWREALHFKVTIPIPRPASPTSISRPRPTVLTRIVSLLHPMWETGPGLPHMPPLTPRALQLHGPRSHWYTPKNSTLPCLYCNIA